jgi:hypothetical protein
MEFSSLTSIGVPFLSLEESYQNVYAIGMTISSRNYIFKTGIFISSAVLILIAAAAFIILPRYPDVVDQAAKRSSGIIESLVRHFLKPAPYAPFVTMAMAVVYALGSLILIYYFFEKTQTPEILFVALFALSFIFEAARIFVPLRAAWDLPGISLIITYRILLFGRYFGIFSLFMASVCAAGLEMQKQGTMILIIAIVTLVISLGVPIDSLSWDTSLCMVSGYPGMFRMVEAGAFLITTVSFFISAYSRGSREYITIGVGSILVFLGRSMLLGSDTWITPLPGLAVLVLGTWFIGQQLHRVYLWL